MLEEELKEKYLQLRVKLYNIKNKLNIQNDNYDDLNILIKETLLVDNDIIENDLFKSLKKENEQIIAELTNIVIPKINNKL